MALSVEKTTSGREYKVKDLAQADFGRLEIELAEVEMPGLMSCRSEFGPAQPFKGAKISGTLHMNIQTAVLIETLTALGAEVRCDRSTPTTTSAPPHVKHMVHFSGGLGKLPNHVKIEL
ncbi:Adenosylhomocysteinase 2 [Asimina triloba]